MDVAAARGGLAEVVKAILSKGKKLAMGPLVRLVGRYGDVFGRVVMPFYYQRVALPDSQILRDIPYRLGRDADFEKHRLDLFLPGEGTPEAWPVLIFVHGGGWTHGDRSFRFGGADVYANIGRFFAARGIGSAVISYRLQPQVGWREQVSDVAGAVGWVYENVARFGGDPQGLFLSGHSAGAQLAARVALDGQALATEDVPRESICGLVPVSAAGLDLADARTYEIGASRSYYEERFRDVEADPDWAQEASTLPFVSGEAPPTWILHAAGDWPPLRRQSALLREALEAHGVPVQLRVAPGVDHYSIVSMLSRSDRQSAREIVEFVRDTHAGATPQPASAAANR